MYLSLKDCLSDLESKKDLVRIEIPVDPDLEMAEIHRRIFECGGPAVYFTQIIGTKFQAASNIYGTKSRIEYLFRNTLPLIKKLGELRTDPSLLLREPGKYFPSAIKSRFAIPRKVKKSKLLFECKISDLPQIRSWPQDGGAFVLLPQVLSVPPASTSILSSNLGMYRIQLAGNDYLPNEEVGLHYQLHRGIGVHHTAYLESNEDFKISIYIGGPPSNALAAIFPLPENMSELTFAGLLNESRFTYSIKDGYFISEQADFVITGTIEKGLKKGEGPFGDHLGYYSLKHDFPVMKVHNVFHRKDPIWHFTVVGRPPQEDSLFGHIIHEVVKDLIPKEFPGLKAMHAVDVAGVHPLLLAIGKERYMPFRERKPEEILTIANRILGSGQTSLAKYLIILAPDRANDVDIYDIPAFFKYVLRRIRFEQDLHFVTNTTVDTLDYSGDGWNSGSKLILACCGAPIRRLATTLPDHFSIRHGFDHIRILDDGILIIQASPFKNYQEAANEAEVLINALMDNDVTELALIVICDDSLFTSANWSNFLWVTFTRSNPSHDVYGVGAFTNFKHWGCKGPLIIDARIKPHHAPVLETDPNVTARVDKLFSKGGALYGLNKKSNPSY